MTSLRDATRELHHAAEAHPVGAAMSDGSMPEAWWADWCGALLTVHAVLDTHLPLVLGRTDELRADLAEMRARGSAPDRLQAAEAYAASLRGDVTGAAYAFTGGHLMGGAVTERRIGHRLPCAHLRWPDRRAALDAWRPWRDRGDAVEPARAAFSAVLSIMDEIVRRAE